MPVAAIVSISESELHYQWFTENGKQRHVASMLWSEVCSIDVFKRDLFSYDLICLQIRATNDVFLEFDEEDPVWDIFVSGLPLHLPGCKAWGDWFSEVAFPAFGEKLKRVFERRDT